MISRFQWLFAMTGVLSLAPGTPEVLFELPVGPLVCREIDVTPADSARSIFEFADGVVNARETLAAFDSAGGPLYMTIQLTEFQEAISISHNVAVRFSMGGQYLRIARTVRDGKVVDDSTAVVSNGDLTPEDVARSRKLAEWLWSRRCAR